MKSLSWIYKNPFLYLSVILLLFVTSCQEDDLGLDSQSEYNVENSISKELSSSNYKRNTESVDTYLTMFSKVFAVAQNDREFRSLILNEAQRQQGGENVVFYAGIRNERLSRGTVAELFADISRDLEYSFEEDFFNNGIVSTIPRLSFTIYTGIEGTDIREWSYDEPALVVPETASFGREEETLVAAFDGDLKEVFVSNTEDPEGAVVVVENNASFILINKELTEGDIENIMTITGVTGICDELLLLINTLIVDLGDLDPSDPLYQVQIMSIQQFMQMYLDLCDDTPTPSCTDGIMNGDETGVDCGGSCPPCEVDPPNDECDDDCERTPIDEREWITEIKVKHKELKKFCKWWKSTCKIQVDVAFGVPSGQTAVLATLPHKFIVGDRGDMKKDKVYETELPLYKWHWCEGDHSDLYAVNFIGKHHNAGNETKIKFGIPDFKIKLFGQEVGIGSIFSAELKFTAKDNNLGGDVVYYCDDITGEDPDDDGEDDGFGYDSGIIKFWITEKQ